MTPFGMGPHRAAPRTSRCGRSGYRAGRSTAAGRRDRGRVERRQRGRAGVASALPVQGTSGSRYPATYAARPWRCGSSMQAGPLGTPPHIAVSWIGSVGEGEPGLDRPRAAQSLEDPVLGRRIGDDDDARDVVAGPADLGCGRVGHRQTPLRAVYLAAWPRRFRRGLGDESATGDEPGNGQPPRNEPPHIRKTPNRVSGIGAWSAASIPIARTRRVSSGSMTPSSQRRAVAK